MKKLITSFFAVTMSLLITSCQQVDKSIKFDKLTEQEIANGKLTPEILLKLRRISETTVSPDGTMVAYSVSCQNVKNNSTYSNLFYAIIGDTLNKNITSTNSDKNFSPQWSADGKYIFFLSSTKTCW